MIGSALLVAFVQPAHLTGSLVLLLFSAATTPSLPTRSFFSHKPTSSLLLQDSFSLSIESCC